MMTDQHSVGDVRIYEATRMRVAMMNDCRMLLLPADVRTSTSDELRGDGISVSPQAVLEVPTN